MPAPVQFPSLVPSERTYVDGKHAFNTTQTMSGVSVRRLITAQATEPEIRVKFNNITDTAAESILKAYDAAYGTRTELILPRTITAGISTELASLIASDTTSDTSAFARGFWTENMTGLPSTFITQDTATGQLLTARLILNSNLIRSVVNNLRISSFYYDGLTVTFTSSGGLGGYAFGFGILDYANSTVNYLGYRDDFAGIGLLAPNPSPHFVSFNFAYQDNNGNSNNGFSPGVFVVGVGEVRSFRDWFVGKGRYAPTNVVGTYTWKIVYSGTDRGRMTVKVYKNNALILTAYNVALPVSGRFIFGGGSQGASVPVDISNITITNNGSSLTDVNAIPAATTDSTGQLQWYFFGRPSVESTAPGRSTVSTTFRAHNSQISDALIYAPSSSLLLHMVQHYISLYQSRPRILDTSGRGIKVIIEYDAVITNEKSRFGETSLYCGPESSVSIFELDADTTIYALELLKLNFTLDMWINTANTSQYATIYGNALYFSLRLNSSTTGDVAFWVTAYSSTQPLLQTTGVNVCSNTWRHIALTRSGSQFFLFVDGVQCARTMWNGTINSVFQNVITIGHDAYLGRNLIGYIDELRFTQYARYTSTFTPPTTPYPDF